MLTAHPSSSAAATLHVAAPARGMRVFLQLFDANTEVFKHFPIFHAICDKDKVLFGVASKMRRNVLRLHDATGLERPSSQDRKRHHPSQSRLVGGRSGSEEGGKKCHCNKMLFVVKQMMKTHRMVNWLHMPLGSWERWAYVILRANYESYAHYQLGRVAFKEGDT